MNSPDYILEHASTALTAEVVALSIKVALSALSQRHCDIVTRRFGIGRKRQTQQEIADEFDCHPLTIARIERRALHELSQSELLKNLIDSC